MVLIAKSSVKIHLSESIQYHNTDNPSQIIFKLGGFATRGCLSQQPIIVKPPRVFDNGKAAVVCPPGVYHNGGLMKTLHW